MIVKQAKEISRQWVMEAAGKTPGFIGAFYHGSTNWLPEGAELAATSDVDIMVVLADPDPPVKPGKFLYGDVLLEVSYLSADRLQSPEQVLGDYHLAGSFRAPGIILDPSGRLAGLQAAVAHGYAKRGWVIRRCEHARDRVLYGARLNASDPFHDQVLAWIFPAGITTHVLLAAGLKNPTVRRRYMAAQELLAEYGRPEFHETLLETLGSAGMSRARVEQHLEVLSEVFDAAATVVKTPFFFASDISDVARPIAIDGSREMIERGLHREALFWMVVTYSRCLKVFYQDTSVEMRERFNPGYERLLRDLGIGSFADLQRRREQVTSLLPRVWEVAEAIMAANPEIEAD